MIYGDKVGDKGPKSGNVRNWPERTSSKAGLPNFWEDLGKNGHRVMNFVRRGGERPNWAIPADHECEFL